MTPSDAAFPAVCFGKLPSFGDFVRHNASGRETLAMDDWLRQGMFHARTQLSGEWDRAFTSGPAHAFVFAPESAGRFMVGHIRPSHDKSNRRYPFFISLLVDRARFGDDKAFLVPVVFREFLEAADGLVSKALDGMEFPLLVEATERVRVPLALDLEAVSRRHETYLRETRLEQLFASTLGEGAGKRKYLLFKNLMEILVPLRRYGLSRFTMGLRFPAAGTDDEVAHQASFWVQLAARIAGAGGVQPVLFWTARGDAARSVLMFLRPPSARYFLQLLRPDLPSDGICIPAEERGRMLDGIEGLVSKRCRDMLEANTVTLARALEEVEELAREVR